MYTLHCPSGGVKIDCSFYCPCKAAVAPVPGRGQAEQHSAWLGGRGTGTASKSIFLLSWGHFTEVSGWCHSDLHQQLSGPKNGVFQSNEYCQDIAKCSGAPDTQQAESSPYAVRSSCKKSIRLHFWSRCSTCICCYTCKSAYEAAWKDWQDKNILLICNGNIFTHMNRDVEEKRCNDGETSQRKCN